MRNSIREKIRQAISNQFGDVTAPDFSVEAPEQAAHGDYATNVAMVLAGVLKKPPLAIAEAITEELRRPRTSLATA